MPSNILANAFKFSALASVGFGAVMTIPALAQQHWTGCGFKYTKDIALVSFLWGAGIQFMLGAVQYHIGCLSNKKEMVTFGKLHSLWWALCATLCYYVSPGGPLLLPNVAAMLGLSGLLGYASCSGCCCKGCGNPNCLCGENCQCGATCKCGAKTN